MNDDLMPELLSVRAVADVLFVLDTHGLADELEAGTLANLGAKIIESTERIEELAVQRTERESPTLAAAG